MKHNKRHFTLLELLIVAAILVAIAGIGISNLSRVTDRANDGLVLAEMQTIAKAIRLFKQDTGYYPNTGPFKLSTDDKAKSPANFYQLLSSESPLPSGHQLEKWNPETGRGWRGPYLTGFDDGKVSIGSEINNATFSNVNDPNYYTELDPTEGNIINNISGIADPFTHKPENLFLKWKFRYWDKKDREWKDKERDEWGRPYLVFDLQGQPFLISMGRDGEYGTADDIILNIGKAD